MSEFPKSPRYMTQPKGSRPEITGNPIVDKANIWFHSAQWEANRVAREEDQQIADDLGLPKPDTDHMPDFTFKHSELLTYIDENINKEGTQQMLATFEDVRQATRLQGVDILPQQMQMLQAVISNPDLQ